MIATRFIADWIATPGFAAVVILAALATALRRR
jgi:hypothetical protein